MQKILLLFRGSDANELILRTGDSKACNESWEGQLTSLTSWALTAWILINKVLFFINKRTILRL